MNVKKVTCLMSGKTWEKEIASSQKKDGWFTVKMKNKDVVSFHKDNLTMKAEY